MQALIPPCFKLWPVDGWLPLGRVCPPQTPQYPRDGLDGLDCDYFGARTALVIPTTTVAPFRIETIEFASPSI